MRDKTLDPDESLIASAVVQLSTWILAIFAIVIIALFFYLMENLENLLAGFVVDGKSPYEPKLIKYVRIAKSVVIGFQIDEYIQIYRWGTFQQCH